MRWRIIPTFGIAIVAIGLLGVLPATYACANWWPSTAPICVAVEIVHTWQTLVSGLLALTAAAVTVAYISKQTKQTEELHEQDWRREARSIADTLFIDIVDTADRIKHSSRIQDLYPPLSDTAGRMVPEAAKIAPVLAIALQKHCSEVSAFASEFRSILPTASQQMVATLLARRQGLSYRAHVLSWCFAVAGNQIRGGGKADGPFIKKEDLEKIETAYAVGDSERKYLAHVFETSGLA
jgi:hypothetical protein